jgi:hypothetical protein
VWEWALGLAVGVSGARACRGVLVRLLTVGEGSELHDGSGQFLRRRLTPTGMALRKLIRSSGTV